MCPDAGGGAPAPATFRHVTSPAVRAFRARFAHPPVPSASTEAERLLESLRLAELAEVMDLERAERDLAGACREQVVAACNERRRASSPIPRPLRERRP